MHHVQCWNSWMPRHGAAHKCGGMRVTVSQSSILVIVTTSGVLFDMKMESATKAWRPVGAGEASWLMCMCKVNRDVPSYERSANQQSRLGSVMSHLYRGWDWNRTWLRTAFSCELSDSSCRVSPVLQTGPASRRELQANGREYHPCRCRFRAHAQTKTGPAQVNGENRLASPTWSVRVTQNIQWLLC
jgi:hypothetical protein